MLCKICGKQTKKIFKAKILYKYNIDYFYCDNCGFLQTEEPYWLEEAYKDSITLSDTGILQRNILISNWLTLLLSTIFDKKGKFLDFAGGYGILVRLMRDIGFDFYWYDKYSTNLFARGFEAEMHSESRYDAVTAIECFEHFVNPIKEIENILRFSKNIIFTTELLPDPIPKPESWWYYGLDHGQHISFYSKKTLKFMALKYNLNYTKLGPLHILSNKKIPNIKIKSLEFANKVGLSHILKNLCKSKTWEDSVKLKKEKDFYG